MVGRNLVEAGSAFAGALGEESVRNNGYALDPVRQTLASIIVRSSEPTGTAAVWSGRARVFPAIAGRAVALPDISRPRSKIIGCARDNRPFVGRCVGSRAADRSFPEVLRWGCAMSAYQIDGSGGRAT